MVKIFFTKHAKVEKFNILARHGFKVIASEIRDVIENPENEDKKSDYPNIIVSKTIDKTHILRVVYRKEGGIIKVITFYPAEKGRYY